MRSKSHRAARSRIFGVAAGMLVVTLGIIRLGGATVTGGPPKKSDCYVEFQGITAKRGTLVECTDGDPTCDHDGMCDGTCDFRIQLCINQTDIQECKSPGLVAPPTVKGASFAQPSDLLHPSCGVVTSVKVGTKPAKGRRKAKPKTLKLRATAKAVSGRPKVDRDTITLKCIPRPSTQTCPPPATTTTTTIAGGGCGATTTTTPQPLNLTGIATCTATTTTTVPNHLGSCGNTTVDTGEQCDPPGGQAQCVSGQVCNVSCQCEAAAGCTVCGTPDPPKQLSFTTSIGAGNCGVLRDNAGNIPPKTCNPGEQDAATGTAKACVGGSKAGQSCTSQSDCDTGTCVTTCCSTSDCGPGLFCTDGHTLCGGLYFGGGGVGVPLPSAIPDMGSSLTRVTACNNTTADLTLGPTTLNETGSIRNCTSKDCFFGPPLPIPNPTSVSTSTCVINKVATDASGTGNCTTGAANINLPLSSEIYLTGDLLSGEASNRPDVPGIQPCPVCAPPTPGATPTCLGGPNHGLCCTPADSASLGAAYPTSHDCPPPPAAKIGALPIAFNLTTGTQTVTSTDIGTGSGQVRAYCPFCSNPITGLPHNPATACTTDADCATGAGSDTRCAQRDSGAFGHSSAASISYTGTPAGSMTDRAPHDSTLVSIFCIPPTFSALVDGAADLPGPGAVGLVGKAQLLP